ncbi:hypothetical protein AB0C40_34000 [Streptomyces brevispora]|uniref:hypothetical protein n=1 Tax=Streptomyces brevispora TaxID=887462 RepID=UPI0033FECE1C
MTVLAGAKVTFLAGFLLDKSLGKALYEKPSCRVATGVERGLARHASVSVKCQVADGWRARHRWRFNPDRLGCVEEERLRDHTCSSPVGTTISS